MREQTKTEMKAEVRFIAGIAALAVVSLIAFMGVFAQSRTDSMGPGRHRPSACAPGVWTCLSPIEKPGTPRPYPRVVR